MEFWLNLSDLKNGLIEYKTEMMKCWSDMDWLWPDNWTEFALPRTLEGIGTGWEEPWGQPSCSSHPVIFMYLLLLRRMASSRMIGHKQPIADGNHWLQSGTHERCLIPCNNYAMLRCLPPFEPIHAAHSRICFPLNIRVFSGSIPNASWLQRQNLVWIVDLSAPTPWWGIAISTSPYCCQSRWPWF